MVRTGSRINAPAEGGGPPVAWRDDATDRRGNPSDTYELANRTGSRCARSSRRSVESSAWPAETTTNSAHWTRTRAAVSAWRAIAPADSVQLSPRSGAPAPPHADGERWQSSLEAGARGQ